MSKILPALHVITLNVNNICFISSVVLPDYLNYDQNKFELA